MEVCTNYRYARRHDPKFAQMAEEEDVKAIPADADVKEMADSVSFRLSALDNKI